MGVNSLELHVYLADLCNFKCDHCITKSSPQATLSRLTNEEVQSLALYVEEHLEIVSVHFIGGEPTLQLPLIRKLQGHIHRSIKYVITTNGWFGRDPDRIIGQIRLDEIHISFDAFHAKFIEKDVLKNLIQYCVNKGLKTILKLTLQTQADLILFQDLVIPGVGLMLNRLESAGRGRALPILGDMNLNYWKTTCPSLRRTQNESEALVYFPGKGLTPCCGGLLFDHLVGDEILFSRIDQALPIANKLRSALENAFGLVAEDIGLDTGAYNPRSSCDACEVLFAEQKSSGLPSLYSLATAAGAEVNNYPVKALLPDKIASCLEKNFRLTYLYAGDYTADSDLGCPMPQELKRVVSSKADTPSLVQLSSKFMSQSQADMSPTEIQKNAVGMADFLTYCSDPIVYLWQGNVVAALFVDANLLHPILKRPVTHLGFYGIDREITDPAIRKAIRTEFFREIKRLSTGKTISARIASNNPASQRFATKLGLTPVSLAIGRKPS